jgi:hypothetical protein
MRGGEEVSGKMAKPYIPNSKPYALNLQDVET